MNLVYIVILYISLYLCRMMFDSWISIEDVIGNRVIRRIEWNFTDMKMKMYKDHVNNRSSRKEPPQKFMEELSGDPVSWDRGKFSANGVGRGRARRAGGIPGAGKEWMKTVASASGSAALLQWIALKYLRRWTLFQVREEEPRMAV